MKKIMAFVCVIAMFFMFGVVSYYENNYSISATVTDVRDNSVVVTDIRGIEWKLDTCSLAKGQNVKITFDTNATSQPYDDILKNWKID